VGGNVKMAIIIFDPYQGKEIRINGKYYKELIEDIDNIFRNNSFNSKLLIKDLLIKFDKLSNIFFLVNEEHCKRIKNYQIQLKQEIKDLENMILIEEEKKNSLQNNLTEKQIEDNIKYINGQIQIIKESIVSKLTVIDKIEKGDYLDYTPDDGHYFLKFKEASFQCLEYLKIKSRDTTKLIYFTEYNKEIFDYWGIKAKDYKKENLDSHIDTLYGKIYNQINGQKSEIKQQYFIIDEEIEKIYFTGSFVSLMRFLLNYNLYHNYFKEFIEIGSLKITREFINNYFLDKSGKRFNQNSFSGTFIRAQKDYSNSNFSEEIELIISEFQAYQTTSKFIQKLKGT
jgi:hypothetical protein